MQKINLSPSETFIELFKRSAERIVKPKYYRFQIDGYDQDETDYPTYDEALSAAFNKYEGMMNDDAPEDARNNEVFNTGCEIQTIVYDENGEADICDFKTEKLFWTYERSDYEEHNTLWGSI